MNDLIVVNEKSPVMPWATRVLIDRSTPLGNPFPMRSESDRELVIAQYRVWLWNQLKDPSSPAARAFVELARRWAESDCDLELACHCKPLACHGDVLKSALVWYVNSHKESAS
jgi:hypothetical protein